MVHPYWKAYAAGIVFPTLFLPSFLAVYLLARFVYDMDFAIERIIVFPLALVPIIWGVWNVVYVALPATGRPPLGLHGAIVPLVLAPFSLLIARGLGYQVPQEMIVVLLAGLPLMTLLYFLLWKYFVGFLNRLLGLP